MKIGVQIYSLRKDLKDSVGVKKTFSFLKSVRSQVVELATMPVMSDEELATISQESSVAIVSSHSSFNDIKNNMESLIASHKSYGAEYIGIGSLPPKYMMTKRGVRKFCKIFNEAQKVAEKHGLNMIYHNHAFEFKKFRNTCIYDILLEELSPNVKMCLDCYWAYVGGQNVCELIQKLGSRLAIIHCKDFPKDGDLNGYKMCAVGEGILNYGEYLKAACSVGAKYALVELDESPAPEKDIESSIKHLENLLSSN